MDDEPHVGFVDAHAESDGRHHHRSIGLQELLKPLGADMAVQARMVGERRDAGIAQRLGQLVHAIARAGIDHT